MNESLFTKIRLIQFNQGIVAIEWISKYNVNKFNK